MTPRGSVPVAAACALVLVGCAAPAPSSRIAPADPPGAVRTAAPTDASPPRAAHVTLGPAPADMRQVAWDSVAVPGEFCDVAGTVVLDGGSATAESGSWGPVVVALFDVVYGDLTGDGNDEAALRVDCNNGGGTAAGVLQYGAILVGRDTDRLVSLGSLVPQRQMDGQLPTLMTIEEWRPGEVVVHEHWYRSSDSTCCPSGLAEVRWTFREGLATPGPVHVLE